MPSITRDFTGRKSPVNLTVPLLAKKKSSENDSGKKSLPRPADVKSASSQPTVPASSTSSVILPEMLKMNTGGVEVQIRLDVDAKDREALTNALWFVKELKGLRNDRPTETASTSVVEKKTSS